MEAGFLIDKLFWNDSKIKQNNLAINPHIMLPGFDKLAEVILCTYSNIIVCGAASKCAGSELPHRPCDPLPLQLNF